MADINFTPGMASPAIASQNTNQNIAMQVPSASPVVSENLNSDPAANQILQNPSHPQTMSRLDSLLSKWQQEDKERANNPTDFYEKKGIITHVEANAVRKGQAKIVNVPNRGIMVQYERKQEQVNPYFGIKNPLDVNFNIGKTMEQAIDSYFINKNSK